MIKNWVITGDTHGYNEARLQSIKRNFTACVPEETAVIILGDAGFQYYKNKKDWKNKHCASKLGYTLYCLRVITRTGFPIVRMLIGYMMMRSRVMCGSKTNSPTLNILMMLLANTLSWVSGF